MELQTYQIEHQVEANHWWFYGRRVLFKRHIEALQLPKRAPILDVGCSSGTNLRMLKEMNFQSVTGLDISDIAQKYCEEKCLGPVVIADIQERTYKQNYFDLILFTDVLEHLRKEREALTNIHTMLKPGGYLLVTVPCFMTLWGPQDILAHHCRRYHKKEIVKQLKEIGFQICSSHYFNFLLFFPILIARKFLMARKMIIHEGQINSPALNFIFKGIFLADCLLSKYLKPPFGVSACIIARKES
jgi:2-polyprenyl-3-methyl-5-hydroxy-6-metoxy-1,4-benzoquinol methylase